VLYLKLQGFLNPATTTKVAETTSFAIYPQNRETFDTQKVFQAKYIPTAMKAYPIQDIQNQS